MAKASRQRLTRPRKQHQIESAEDLGRVVGMRGGRAEDLGREAGMRRLSREDKRREK
jgi:hypothetical protein